MRILVALLLLLGSLGAASAQTVVRPCVTSVTAGAPCDAVSTNHPLPVITQGGGGGATTTQAKITVAVTNTYQQALAASSTRIGCTIQYIAVAGTKGYVFFGAAPADTTTSFQLTDKQSLNCAVGGSAVATDAVQVTGTGTDIFVVSNQ